MPQYLSQLRRLAQRHDRATSTALPAFYTALKLADPKAIGFSLCSCSDTTSTSSPSAHHLAAHPTSSPTPSQCPSLQCAVASHVVVGSSGARQKFPQIFSMRTLSLTFSKLLDGRECTAKVSNLSPACQGPACHSTSQTQWQPGWDSGTRLSVVQRSFGNTNMALFGVILTPTISTIMKP